MSPVRESTPERIGRIVVKHAQIAREWRDGGWAPREAQILLAKGDLERLTALASTLSIWLKKSPQGQEEGRLVLGWANLGALVEGTMTWFLCVHEDSYAAAPLIDKHGNRLEPDDIWFARLIRYYQDKVLDRAAVARWSDWLDTVRLHRNAIHAYRRRHLGSPRDLRRAMRRYAAFLADLQSRIPDEPAQS